LANTKSAIKRIKQAERQRTRNRSVRTRVRTAGKAALAAIGTPEAAAALQTAQSVIDRAAKRGVLHPRAAARRKSRLARRANAAAAQA